MTIGRRIAAAGLGLALAVPFGLPPATGAAASDLVAHPVAVLQGLNKITARVSKFEAPVGTPVQFGSLSIVVRVCKKSPPEDKPETAAFLQIFETRHGEATKPVFSGWMFAASPALSALQNPVYDVNLLDCTGKAESGSPASAAGSAAGKSAGAASAAASSR